MKKQLFLLAMVLLPMVANAHDIEVQNADGVTIYYNYTNGGKELAVTYRGSSRGSYFYTGSIVIPESVNYNAVTYSVTSIGSSAFYDCTGLTSVSIPNSVTSIGSSAFYDCTGFTSITIPNSVTSIGYNAFYGCSGLKKVIVSDIAAWCGMIFGDNPLSYAKHLYSDENTEIKDLVIPNNVTSINNKAFQGCSGLTSVTIPNSVTSIGDNAFSGCTGLNSVTIGNSVTSIGTQAFQNCYALTSVNIPNSVTSIGDNAFYGCSKLTSVTIDNNAIVSNNYSSSSSLKDVFGTQVKAYILGNEVQSIGNSAFRGCSGLTSVTIPNSVASIGTSAFYGCYRLASVIIPNKVTSISSSAFSGCSGLTSVTIPNSVSKISDYAFSGCSSLTSVTIPNSVSMIREYTFKDCTGLASVTIPNSVISIDSNAFSGCKGLKKVIVSDIAAWCGMIFGDNPLSYAKHLYSDENTEITDLVIPNSVKAISNNAFLNCSGLTSLTLNNVKDVGSNAFSGCTGLSSVHLNSVKYIASSAFSGCTGLTSIEIPNSVISIGGGAFGGCAALTSVTLNSDSIVSADRTVDRNNGNTLGTIFGHQVTEYIIGEGVTRIGICAFHYNYKDNDNFTSITIPNSVTSIGYNAFYGCSGLKKVIVSDIAAWCGMIFGDNPLSYAKHLYSDENTEIKDLVIPNNVTSINNKAFQGCSGLTSVTIPNSVTSIGDNAFSGCTGLNSVTIGNSVTSIGDNAFSGCTGLNSVTIGNSVTSIGTQAFQNCYALTSVNIPNSVTSIGDNAFSGCTGLNSVTIPNSVTSIGKEAFSGCTGLNSVTIPNSVTSIGSSAFYNCTGLTSVTIPNSVTSIGDKAFSGVDYPTVISLIEDPFPITGKSSTYYCVFSQNTFNKATLYVPKGTINKYKGTKGWRDFVYMVEGVPSSIDGVLSDEIKIDFFDGTLKILGLRNETQIRVYDAKGTQAGSSVSQNGAAIVNTNLQPGSIAIVRIGEKSFKVVVK